MYPTRTNSNGRVMTSGTKEVVLTTCPRDCYDGCGIAVVRRGGKVSLVAGNPEHPSNQGPLCGKCSVAYNGVWRDEKARLSHPLKRVGAKGRGEFEAVTWDQALSEIATKLTRIKESHGAQTIINTHYTGTCSLIAGDFPNRFFRHLGATEAEPDTVCNNAGHLAWRYVFGDSLNGFDPRTVKDSKCLLIWGANPSSAAPHVDRHWIRESGATVIVIDPIGHDTAARADLHLRPRPGSDAALAFAMAHVIQRDGLLDETFIRENVVGYDDVSKIIAQCTPQWAEGKTGVPAGLIEQAAQIYGRGPSMMWLGQGLQRQATGGNIFRACAMLAALSGNICKAGTGAYYLNSTFDIAARQGSSPRFEPGHSQEGTKSVSQMDMPGLLNNPDRVRAYMVWNCNPVASNPAQTETRRGLSRDDLFTVVIDCFMSDTAKYGDFVLPAASFLEFDDLCASYFQLTIGPQVKCTDPLGQALPNQEIFRRLSRAMGFEAAELYENDQSIIDAALQDCKIGLSWAELKEKGWTYISEEPLILWRDRKFATPSGKIEIASKQASDDGLPLVPQPFVDPPPAAGRLRLLSPADPYLMNSTYGNDSRIRELMGPAGVTIHPEDATARGIQSGDRVVLSNESGELALTAKIDASTLPGVLLTHKSRWPGHEMALANVNVLHTPQKTDMGESTSVHATTVTLDKS